MKRDLSRGLIAGVCAGIAKDLDVNPWVIRVLFLLFAHFVGFGIIAYLCFWLLMPAGE